MDLFAQTISSFWVGNNHQQIWSHILHIWLQARKPRFVEELVIGQWCCLLAVLLASLSDLMTIMWEPFTLSFPYGLQTCMIWWLCAFFPLTDLTFNKYRWWVATLDTALASSCFRTAPMWPSTNTQVYRKCARLWINVLPTFRRKKVQPCLVCFRKSRCAKL